MKLLCSLYLFLLTIFSTVLFSQNYHIQENFNNSSLPTSWTNNATVGANSWSFGINASASTIGNNNINGTALAYFDDDALGGSSNNTVQLTTPSFNNSATAATYLEFDYNFREFAGIADSFKVEVYDGSSWLMVFNRTADDCGNWVLASCAGNFPHANIDISSFANANCQVRFVYHDGGDWAWFAAIDNVEIWSPYPNDVRVSSITQITSSCVSTDSLKVTIENIGSSAVSNFNVNYILNGSAPVSASFSGSLAAASSASFTFPNPVTYNIGSNDLKVYTALSSDQNNSNDTSQLTINVLNKYNLPYQEGFESNNHNWTTSGTNSSWAVGVPNSTIISSAALGTKAAVTNLNGSYNNNELSYINSPCIYIGPNATIVKVSFDLIHHIETGFDRTWLEYSTDGGISYSKVQGDSIYSSRNWYNVTNNYWDGINSGWDKSSVVMRIPINTTIRFRFVFQSDGSTQLEGFGIDNFIVRELGCTDLSLTSILSPSNNSTCGASLEFINVELENIGITPINNGLLSYHVNGGTIFTDTLTNSIQGGQVVNFQFSQPFDFSILTNPTLKTWIDIPNDSIQVNDTNQVLITHTANVSQYRTPYFQDFDYMTPGQNPSRGWTRNPSGTNFTFTWVSTNGSTPSTNTGPSNDATGGNYWFLESSYTGTDAILESPCIFITNDSNLVLEFKYHMYGASMGTLYIDILDGQNWINVDRIVGQQQTANSEPWRTRIIDLSQINSRTIKVRFRGRETGTNGIYSDMAIDDVKVINNDDNIVLSHFDLDSTTCNSSGIGLVSFRLNKRFLGIVDKDSLRFELYQNGTLLATEQLLNDLDSNYLDTMFTLAHRPNTALYGSQQFKVRSIYTKNGAILIDSTETEIVNSVNQLPYSQGFESLFDNCNDPLEIDNSNGWFVDTTNFTWYVGNFVLCNATSFSLPPVDSSGYMYTYFDLYNPNGHLNSPCFDLSSYTRAEVEYYFMRFKGAPLTPPDSLGDLVLEMEVNGSWIEIDRQDTVIYGSIGNQSWIKSTVDISSYISSNTSFRFKREYSTRHVTGVMAIDAFKVYDPLLTSIENPLNLSLSQSLSIFPNPNNGSFKVNVPEEFVGLEYQIIDLKGKMVKRDRFSSNTEQIDLELEKGIYFLRVPEKGIHEKIVLF